MKKFFFLAATLLLLGSLTTFGVIADPDIPEGAAWSDPIHLDTTGQTKALLPTYPIPYSAKWAENKYDRTFAFSAEKVEGGVSYPIEEFAQEAEGTYVWDYSEIPETDLPRGTSYNLYYVIKNGTTVYDSQVSTASVILLPEPCVALVLTVLGLAILRRK